MSDNEAMYALRALNALRSDIADIAGSPAPLNEPVDPFDSITLTAAPEQLDSDENEAPTLEEVATAFKEAWGIAQNCTLRDVPVTPLFRESGEYRRTPQPSRTHRKSDG